MIIGAALGGEVLPPLVLSSSLSVSEGGVVFCAGVGDEVIFTIGVLVGAS